MPLCRKVSAIHYFIILSNKMQVVFLRTACSLPYFALQVIRPLDRS